MKKIILFIFILLFVSFAYSESYYQSYCMDLSGFNLFCLLNYSTVLVNGTLNVTNGANFGGDIIANSFNGSWDGSNQTLKTNSDVEFGTVNSINISAEQIRMSGYTSATQQANITLYRDPDNLLRPTLELTDTGILGTGRTTLWARHSGSNYNSYSVTGYGAVMGINPSPVDGTSSAYINLLRSTDTTGDRYVNLFRGDNSNTVTGRWRGSDGWAIFGISGYIEPSYTLHVVGDGYFSDDITIGDDAFIGDDLTVYGKETLWGDLDVLEGNIEVTVGTITTHNDIEIDTNAVDKTAQLVLDSPNNRVSQVLFLEGDALRWINRDDSNNNNDYSIMRYSGASAYQDTPFLISGITGDTKIDNKLNVTTSIQTPLLIDENGLNRIDSNNALLLDNEIDISYDWGKRIFYDDSGMYEQFNYSQDGLIEFYDNDIKTEGNFTGNQIYAQVCYHNHTASPLNFVTANKFYNMTFNLNEGYYSNGFTSDGEHSVTALVSGLYDVDYSATGDGQNNHEYVSKIAVNDKGWNCTAAHKKMAAGGDIVTMTGGGFVEIEAGDEVSLKIADDGGTGLGNYYAMKMNLVRIGDIPP